MIKEWPDLKNSTSNEDCYFLKKLCKEYNPTKILEIGTFVGKSAYAIASASECMIYTVDCNMDKFADMIREELTNRQYPENVAAGIEYLLNQPDGNKRVFALCNPAS